MATLFNPDLPSEPLFAHPSSVESVPADSVIRSGFIAPSVVSSTLPENITYPGAHLIDLKIEETEWEGTVTDTGGGGGGGGLLLNNLASATRIEGRLGAMPISETEVRERLNRGQEAAVYYDVGGTAVVSFGPVVVNPEDATPDGTTVNIPPGDLEIRSVPRRMLLVEVYRLTMFLGQYGKGRVLKTLSLLPGERARLSIFTYRHTEETTREASTIFDSFSTAQETELTSQIQIENSTQNAYERTTGTSVSAQTAVPIWRISVSAQSSLNTRVARESLYKTVSEVTSRQVNQASARRDVTIDTSLETRVAFGEEYGTVREIENVNLSKTLNFVFRQMNQEVLTLLHLVDVRVAYENGNVYEETSLEQLDGFLKKYIKVDSRTGVRDRIKELLTAVRTYTWRSDPGSPSSVRDVFQEIAIRTGTTPPEQTVLAFRDTVSRYTYQYNAWEGQTAHPQTQTFEVPGLLIEVGRHVLRTDAVLAEGFVLENESTLDKYGMQKQQEDIRTRKALNTILEAASGRIAAGDAATIQPVLDAVAEIGKALSSTDAA